MHDLEHAWHGRLSQQNDNSKSNAMLAWPHKLHNRRCASWDIMTMLKRNARHTMAQVPQLFAQRKAFLHDGCFTRNSILGKLKRPAAQ
jgi:hypothetical protein